MNESQLKRIHKLVHQIYEEIRADTAASDTINTATTDLHSATLKRLQGLVWSNYVETELKPHDT